MHKKKAGKFMFIRNVLVVVFFPSVALLNNISAELNGSSVAGKLWQ